MTGRRAKLAGLAAIAALVVSACQSGPSAADVARLHARAQTVLDRWAASVEGSSANIGLVGGLTGQVGTWEPQNGDNKQSLYAGLVEPAPSMTIEGSPASTGDVVWPTGDKVTVAIVSAAEALKAIASDPSVAACPECTPLVATSARLVTDTLQTTRGPATGPIWQFTISGTAVKVTRVAIAAPATVAPMPDEPGDTGVATWVQDATVAADGRSLTLTFVGSPYPGNQGCGEDYTAEAIESDLAVAVIVYRHPYVTLGIGCPAVGAERTAVASLARPLGDRAVLDTLLGTAVPLK